MLNEIQRLRAEEDFQPDNRISFLWPKMHSLAHLIESIKGKGATANTATDGGEALHPQTRKHWQRSNRQPETAEDQVRGLDLPPANVLTYLQMLRMEYEKEVVLDIRHRIDVYEQWREFDDDVADEQYNVSPATFNHSHVHLGSRQRGLKLPSYETVLEEMLGFHNFGDSLAEFLRDYALVEVYGSDFEGDGFEGHQNCIYWCKVGFALLSTATPIDQ